MSNSSDYGHEKIVIIRDGRYIYAKKYENDKLVLESGAICHVDDAFDFNFGATLAFNRLKELDRATKNTKYSGSVYCEDSVTKKFTPGRIYKIRNGFIINDIGEKNSKPFISFKDFFVSLAPDTFVEIDNRYYTGNVFCCSDITKIKRDGTKINLFSKGWVYPVINGKIRNSFGEYNIYPYKNIDQLNLDLWNEFISGPAFIEVVNI